MGNILSGRQWLNLYGFYPSMKWILFIKKNKDVQTKLLLSLVIGTKYLVSTDLAAVTNAYDGYVYYNGYPQLKISGGNNYGVANEILYISSKIKNTGCILFNNKQAWTKQIHI